MKIVFIIIDGLPDEPSNGKTPLSEAYTPNLDFFAENGVTGELFLLPEDLPVWSHFADVALLGFNPKKYYLKRGPLEALAADIELTGDFLAIRCNFATIDEEGRIIDRRAGRAEYGLDKLAECIEKMNFPLKFIFKRTYGHRAVLIFKEKLSDKISSNDPLETGKKPLPIKPLDKDKLSEFTAKIVNQFVAQAFNLLEMHPINLERTNLGYLPANYLLLRGAGNRVERLPDFGKRWNKKCVCISEPGVTKAVCMLAGFDAITVKKENIKGIVEKIFDCLSIYDFVLAHIKGPDEPAHDGDFERKKKIIEKIDEELTPFRKFDGILVITSDHITSTIHKKHMHGPVPVLVYGKGKDEVKKFDEISVKKGKLKNFDGKKLWEYVMKNEG